jgi:hypothetical protein
MRFVRGTAAKSARRTSFLAALFCCCSPTAFAAPVVDALVQTPSFNELTSYDANQINNPFFSGFDARFLAPLNITNLLPQNSITSIADSGSTVYGLIRTPSFDELTAYNRNQINNPFFSGFDAQFLAPLNITNLLPQNSIISIAASGSTVFGLIQTASFNEVTAYDTNEINNPDFSGFDAKFLAPLNITNLLPQNGITSIAVEGSTLYGLIRTPSFDELVAYDLNQINEPFFSGFEAKFLAPLNITNLLPQNSIISISVSGNELYALVQTDGFNELMGYDLDQINEPFFSGFDADFLAPLNITNLLPQNSIIAIAVENESGGGGGAGGGMAAPEASTWAMMLLGFVGVGYFGRRRMKVGALAPGPIARRTRAAVSPMADEAGFHPPLHG